ncbi:MAG TPA: protein kinase [Vicinamibacteria bacterium]|nr:protein kinase [Vicinamibacteria bacterium]
MSLEAGQRLGHYEIVGLGGVGGMGELYKAKDTKLRRDVAIKTLPQAFAEDRERLARFAREAKLLASLNHPNIATLYGLEDHDGQPILVMEWVEGETLEARLSRGPLPLDELLALFEQMAKGLEAAHEKSVIHRDLKPANVKIAEDGTVKILDFGLARLAETDGDKWGQGASQSPTLTKDTALGAILGTASYMSPEQAKGQSVDRRTDIWAFGSCLYEALSGVKAFQGETFADVLAKTLEREPDFEALPTSTPASIRLLLQRCLEKDPKQRLRDIGDARLEIRDAFSRSASPTTIAESRKAALSFGVAGGLALGFAMVGGLEVWRLTRSPHEAPHPTRLTLELPNIAPSDAAIFGFSLFELDISPDGRQIAYVVQGERARELRLRSLDEISPKPIPNTEGASAPFFSSDGQWIGFHADGKIRRVAPDGSQLLSLCEAPGFAGASWGPDDTIIFAGKEGLYHVAARGGAASLVVAPNSADGEALLGWPRVLPDAKHVLATVLMEGSIVDDPRARIVVVSLETGERRIVTEAGSNPRYVPTGHVVFGWGGDLYAVGFDVERLTTRGTPLPVVQGVRSDPFIGTDFAVSDEGSLVYARAPALGSPASLHWADRQGRRGPFGEELRRFRFPRLSPDGRLLAVAIGAPGRSDIWVYDLNVEPPVARRLTSEGNNSVPVWTPDGRELYFTNAGNMMAVATVARGRELSFGTPQALFDGFLQGGGPRSYDVAPDGRFLVVVGDTEVPPRDELVIVLDWFEELERQVPSGS